MRRIKNYTLDDLDRDLVTKYFMAYSSAKDEKYEEFIEEARDIVFEKVKVLSVYESFPTNEYDSYGFENDLLKKAMAVTDSVYVTLSSIINEKEVYDVTKDDPIIDFFAQSWMVAILNATRDRLNLDLTREILDESHKLSSVWSPGQAGIPLENQKLIFDLIKPEDLGISITKHMKMIPQMTVSGIMGTLDINFEEKYNSCDFCERKKVCPGYNGITLKGKEFNRHLK